MRESPSKPRVLLAMLGAVAVVALGARVEVPMAPVPMTLQSLAVVATGGLLGAPAATLAMFLYLAAGALGLPVFAGGASGAEALAGPTAGYLWSFPLAAALAGFGPPGRSWRSAGIRTALYGVGHLLILGLGALWLARGLGLASALAQGAWPFLPGAVVKSAFAAWLVGVAPWPRTVGSRAVDPVDVQ